MALCMENIGTLHDSQNQLLNEALDHSRHKEQQRSKVDRHNFVIPSSPFDS